MHGATLADPPSEPAMSLLPPTDPVPETRPAVEDATRAEHRFGKPSGGWRLRLYEVIFESETRAGRAFDLSLIAVILLSVAVVVIDSVQAIHVRWGPVFGRLEWCFTLIFTVEYVGRLACLRRPGRYARSFYGVIDLLALLPTYLAILVPGLAVLIDVRILRLLRVFRIFKMSRYAHEYRTLATALAASRRKIMVFVGFVMMVVLVMGTLMYVVEGPQHGFTSIPVAVYWAVSTMTTVGFGDLVPKTGLGRAIASALMLLGWGVLAVPTGIVSAEMVKHGREPAGDAPAGMAEAKDAGRGVECAACGSGAHAADARFCRRCGATLPAH
jgi:voltage-gated potassium channel